MKQTAMYLCLFIKRVLKRPVFLILMFSIPFISIWLKNVFTIDNINLKVALYTDDSTGIAYKSVNALVNTDDTISFVQQRRLATKLPLPKNNLKNLFPPVHVSADTLFLPDLKRNLITMLSVTLSG